MRKKQGARKVNKFRMMGILGLVVLIGECAWPQVRELGNITKTKIILVEEIKPYELVETWDGGPAVIIGAPLNDPEDLELAEIYRAEIIKKLKEEGFEVLDKLPVEAADRVSVLRIRLAYALSIPLVNWGGVLIQAEVYQKGTSVLYLERLVNTSHSVTVKDWGVFLSRWLVKNLKKYL